MATARKDPKLGAPKLDEPQLQAGGGTASIYDRARIVDSLSPLFTKYLQTVHDELAKSYALGFCILHVGHTIPCLHSVAHFYHPYFAHLTTHSSPPILVVSPST